MAASSTEWHKWQASPEVRWLSKGKGSPVLQQKWVRVGIRATIPARFDMDIEWRDVPVVKDNEQRQQADAKAELSGMAVSGSG
jgi:hypothetical protein